MHITDILPLLSMIKDDWLKLKTIKERNIMINRAHVARVFTIFGYFIMFMTLILGTILPIFGILMRYLTNRTDSGRLMPLQTYYIFNQNKTPFYEITYTLQCFSVIAAAIIYTGTDSFLSLLVFHACGQLENLKAHIINLDKFNNFNRTLSSSVRDYNRLIKLVDIVDKIK